MDDIIIHVDMDAFFAAVEIRDDPSLERKPVIIGALPHERGVVSTCNYEARKFGVRSGMSIKDAYRLCPQGVYMHPNIHKYIEVSNQMHTILNTYTDIVEYLSLDEGYLDVTRSAQLFGGASNIGHEIKRRIRQDTGVTCSVGIGYSMMSAKLASEEKKPDGYFEIRSAEALKHLIIDRNVRIIYGIGEKTAEALAGLGIKTVRDIYNNKQIVTQLLGNYSQSILDLAEGIDNRKVTPYSEAKSLGKEHTFQKDITDFDYLKDSLILIAKNLSYELHDQRIYCRTVTLKITYSNMQQITRSKSGETTNKADDIYYTAAAMLDKIDRYPVRLVGISLSGLSKTASHQMTLFDSYDVIKDEKNTALFEIQKRYGRNSIITANELKAKKRFDKND